jgi:hypothetical protein
MLSLGRPVTLTYRTVITNYAGYDVVGRASLSDGYGEVWDMVVRTAVPDFKFYFPLVFKDQKYSFWPLDAP